MQTSLEAAEQIRRERGGLALIDTTGEDATRQAIVRSLLGITDPTVFRLDRKTSAADRGYSVTPTLKPE